MQQMRRDNAGGQGVGDPQVYMCETCAQGERLYPLVPNREVINNLIIWCPLNSRGVNGKVTFLHQRHIWTHVSTSA